MSMRGSSGGANHNVERTPFCARVSIRRRWPGVAHSGRWKQRILTPKRKDAKMDENAIGKAVRVHRELGPGLLETVYEVVLARELEHRGMRVERQRRARPSTLGSRRSPRGITRGQRS
jgi:hypothetical protein